MKSAMHYQQDGFVSGFSQKSLSEANRQIASAKQATPEKFREQFRSSIRSNGNGYVWLWVLK